MCRTNPNLRREKRENETARKALSDTTKSVAWNGFSFGGSKTREGLCAADKRENEFVFDEGFDSVIKQSVSDRNDRRPRPFEFLRLNGRGISGSCCAFEDQTVPSIVLITEDEMMK